MSLWSSQYLDQIHMKYISLKTRHPVKRYALTAKWMMWQPNNFPQHGTITLKYHVFDRKRPVLKNLTSPVMAGFDSEAHWRVAIRILSVDVCPSLDEMHAAYHRTLTSSFVKRSSTWSVSGVHLLTGHSWSEQCREFNGITPFLRSNQFSEK